MAKIYKFFQVKFTESWYQLSQAEQERLLAQVGEARDKVGGKTLILCDTSWSSEAWSGFGVEEFPDIEAVQKHSALLNELNWFRYIESTSSLGTEWQAPS